MKKLLLLLVLLPSIALAADGDNCDPLIADMPEAGAGIGGRTQAFCKILVDHRDDASGGPVVLDLGSFDKLGVPKDSLPEEIDIRLVVNSCTTGTITLSHSLTNGGFKTLFASASSIISLAPAGNTRIYDTTAVGPWINAEWSGVGTCGVDGGFMIYILGYTTK